VRNIFVNAEIDPALRALPYGERGRHFREAFRLGTIPSAGLDKPEGGERGLNLVRTGPGKWWPDLASPMRKVRKYVGPEGEMSLRPGGAGEMKFGGVQMRDRADRHELLRDAGFVWKNFQGCNKV
jgi:hypothetical protein